VRTIFWSGLSAVLVWTSSFASDTNLPTTLAELNRWYVEPPAGQNAATKCLEAMAALKTTDADANSANLPLVGKGELPAPDKPLPPAMKAAIAEFIQRNQPAFPIFEQGAKFPQSRYPIDLNRGQATLLAHLPKISKATQILELFSVSQAVAGHGKESGDAVLVSLALARSLESEPCEISQVVRGSCNMITVAGLEQALNRAVLPPQTLDQLQKSLQQSEEREAAGFGFTRAIVGERTMDLSLFAMPLEEWPLEDLFAYRAARAGTPEEREQLKRKIKVSLTADRRHMEATFNEALAVRNEPFPRRLRQNEVFSQAATIASNIDLIWSGMVFDGLKKVASREARSLAYLRVAQTAVALERFRSVHAGYPESLSELTPNYLNAVPADPFDGQSLRYHKADKGYVLYSIGPDLNDDGGKRFRGRKGDIVISVVNPPKPTP
jgi:hypothetical protein